MTESQFWGKVRSALRKAFAAWEPANQAMKNARRPYTGPNKRQKFEVRCAGCGGWFPMKEVQKDHIEPVGSLKSADDLAGFLERLTPEDPSAYQMICLSCHSKKTKKDNFRSKMA